MTKNLKQILLLGVLAAVSIAIGLWAGMQGQSKPSKGPSYADLGGDFTLTSDQGPVSLHDLRGKVVPIFFGFTACPDVCPTALTALSAALKKLSDEERAQVQPLFISIDPERDDPQRVGEYVRYFHPSVIGLSGTLDEVSRVAKQYLVIFEKVPLGDSTMGYTMDHSAIVYVVGKDGVIDSLVHHGETPDDIAAALREALAR
ncbi:MAG: SCO family protein [Chromatiaceae bacterium]|nr:SCO family protein [Gammaproteobacteria bacterium]MCP5305257.1 SCO family protein [Chromatiaceae bacterium]MCP5315216.1 SCO family protein [Chromatiaceae bacterium]MCP5428640.1 SCO family protein [Chromatiaceae bacterium]